MALMAFRSRHSGFSLTELLVAMAIVVTLMGGLMVLFSGAVSTVRQGYQSMSGTELGRAAITLMERDLQQAFTARDQGQNYQFYGRPDGFMFVGQLSDGKLGRVTYAVHTSAGAMEFPTVMVEFLQKTLERIYEQAYRYALENSRTEAEASVEAQGVVVDFAEAYNVSLGEVNWASGTPFAGIDPSFTIELQVMASSWALVRYEEPGVTDLDTFKLPGNYQWPYIDPANNARDVFTEPNAFLYDQLLSALGGGLREMMSYVPLHQIRPETVKEILAAKKREIWIRMLSGDESIRLLSQDFWARPGAGVASVANYPVEDYVLTERILASAQLLDPAGGAYIRLRTPPNRPVDVLDIPGIFSYGNGKGQFQRYFNDIANIEGYRDYLQNPSPGALENFDIALTRSLGGAALSEAAFGSPLSPRIPRVVNIGYWIMLERTQPGSSDFRQWFNMLVEVPSAATRAMPTSLTPNPGRA